MIQKESACCCCRQKVSAVAAEGARGRICFFAKRGSGEIACYGARTWLAKGPEIILHPVLRRDFVAKSISEELC